MRLLLAFALILLFPLSGCATAENTRNVGQIHEVIIRSEFSKEPLVSSTVVYSKEFAKSFGLSPSNIDDELDSKILFASMYVVPHPAFPNKICLMEFVIRANNFDIAKQNDQIPSVAHPKEYTWFAPTFEKKSPLVSLIKFNKSSYEWADKIEIGRIKGARGEFLLDTNSQFSKGPEPGTQYIQTEMGCDFFGGNLHFGFVTSGSTQPDDFGMRVKLEAGKTGEYRIPASLLKSMFQVNKAN